MEKIAAAPGSGYGAFPGQTFIEPSDGDGATVGQYSYSLAFLRICVCRFHFPGIFIYQQD